MENGMTRILIGGFVALMLMGSASAMSQSEVRRRQVLQVEATAYCVEGETASGAQTRRGIVATDPRVIPLGSRIRVDGLGRRHSRTYDVEDTGREVKGREIDIFMADCGAAKEFGRKPARVRVIEVGDGERKPGTN
jgi:3D (Asp-Asp-Asp) domain-containing protein